MIVRLMARFMHRPSEAVENSQRFKIWLKNALQWDLRSKVTQNLAFWAENGYLSPLFRGPIAIDRRKIMSFIIAVLTIWSTLDGFRDTFIPGNPVSYMKEFLPLVGIFVCLFPGKGRELFPNDRYSLFILITLTAMLIFFAVTTYILKVPAGDLGSNFGGWAIWMKSLTFLWLFLLFRLVQRSYASIFEKIPKLFIVGCIIYSMVTLFFILSGLYKLLPPRCWYGRLAIGYPTMDSLVLSVGMFFVAIEFRGRKRIFFALLFACVLIMQNTATGYLMLCFFIATMIFWLPARWKFLPVLLFAAGAFLGIAAYEYFKTSGTLFGALFVDKANAFLFGGSTASVSIRSGQIVALKHDLFADPVTAIFGGGGGMAAYTENGYWSILGGLGILGAILYIMIFGYLLMRAFATRHFIFIGSIIGFYLIGSLSLIGIYLYPFLFVLAYAAAYVAPHSQPFSGLEVKN